MYRAWSIEWLNQIKTLHLWIELQEEDKIKFLKYISVLNFRQWASRDERYEVEERGGEKEL